MNTQSNNTSNYLVPAAGSTHAVTISDTFSATPKSIDWQSFTINNFPFQPQGCFIDNSEGVADLKITVKPIGFTFSCPAASIAQFQFPAPNNMSMDIVGSGNATIVFVDFPVLPSGNLVKVAGTVTMAPAAGSVFAVTPDAAAQFAVKPVAGQTFDTQPAKNASDGNPYNVAFSTPAGNYHSANIPIGSSSVTIVPTANTSIKNILITYGATSTATEQFEVLTITLNNIEIFKGGIVISPSKNNVLNIPFPINFNAANGNLVVSIGTALATTTFLYVSAYFG